MAKLLVNGLTVEVESPWEPFWFSDKSCKLDYFRLPVTRAQSRKIAISINDGEERSTGQFAR